LSQEQWCQVFDLGVSIGLWHVARSQLPVACGKGNGRFMNLHRPQGGDATNALVWRGQQASEVRVGFGDFRGQVFNLWVLEVGRETGSLNS